MVLIIQFFFQIMEQLLRLIFAIGVFTLKDIYYNIFSTSKFLIYRRYSSFLYFKKKFIIFIHYYISYLLDTSLYLSDSINSFTSIGMILLLLIL